MEQMTVKRIVEAVKGNLLCGEEDTVLKTISIHSGEIGDAGLFVPLLGEKVDAHRFIPQAVANGAAAVLTAKPVKDCAGAAIIQVEDTKSALQDIGRYLRSTISIPLIGVTGTVGKTTTRQMIAAALSAGFEPVFQTPKNYNGQIGVPITLSNIKSEDQIGVIEMGMSEPGEMTVISKIARVRSAVITNIGVTHLEQLKTKENILKEKLAIQDGMEMGGILLLNGDDDYLKNVCAKEGCRAIFCGMQEGCDYRAENIELINGCPSFDVVYQHQRVRISLKIRGEHFVINALLALAAAHQHGILLEQAAVRLGQFEQFDNRQQIYTWRHITMIDDSYNASPVSMKAAINVLEQMPVTGRKIAVLADMKELGDQEREFHRQVGQHLEGKAIDLVLTLGELACEITQSVNDCHNRMQMHHFENIRTLTEFLKMQLMPGDTVLFKGSNSMELGRVIGEICTEGC